MLSQRKLSYFFSGKLAWLGTSLKQLWGKNRTTISSGSYRHGGIAHTAGALWWMDTDFRNEGLRSMEEELSVMWATGTHRLYLDMDNEPLMSWIRSRLTNVDQCGWCGGGCLLHTTWSGCSRWVLQATEGSLTFVSSGAYGELKPHQCLLERQHCSVYWEYRRFWEWSRWSGSQ